MRISACLHIRMSAYARNWRYPQVQTLRCPRSLRFHSIRETKISQYLSGGTKCSGTGWLRGLRPRRRRRRRPVAVEAGAVSGTDEESAVPGPSGESQVPVQQQPEACIVLQTTPEASAAGEYYIHMGRAPNFQLWAFHGGMPLDVTTSEHEGPRSPVVMQPVDTPPGDAAVDRILYLLDLQQKAFRRLNRDVAQLRQTLGLPPAVVPTDSEGPCSDPGATARGDLPLAIPAVAAAAPRVESGATPPPVAGPSTSHGM
ncbi:UNVERIFIED_CONTAM: hypothetical protein K2H54_044092 [Gekko kuhli]